MYLNFMILNRAFSCIQTQMTRIKEQCEKLDRESLVLKTREQQALDNNKKVMRQTRELKEDFANLQQKESDAQRRLHQMVRRLFALKPRNY